MSYNITTFKLKKLENLIVPIAEFFTHEREDYHPKRVNEDDGSVTLWVSAAGSIKGDLIGDMLYITDVDDITDEFSGTSMGDVIVPALKKSTGVMEAVCVWEGGDDITRIKFINGVYTEESIEL